MMLYLGIDQHSQQLTVCVRDEAGQIVQRKQVSTRGRAVDEFLEQLTVRSGDDGYAAVVEVCGFNDWLLDRVAVMRRLTTILWHMLTRGEAYQLGGVRRKAGDVAPTAG